MPHDDTIQLPLLLSPEWWRRLQRVAETCSASPREFVRETVEAEIVRREVLLEQEGTLDPSWLMLLTRESISSKLQ
jgi:hypothetical protein